MSKGRSNPPARKMPVCYYCKLRPVYANHTCRVCREFISANWGQLPGPVNPPEQPVKKYRQLGLFDTGVQNNAGRKN